MTIIEGIEKETKRVRGLIKVTKDPNLIFLMESDISSAEWAIEKRDFDKMHYYYNKLKEYKNGR